MDDASPHPNYVKGSATSQLAVLPLPTPFKPFLSSVKEPNTYSYHGPLFQLLAWLSSRPSSEPTSVRDPVTASIFSHTDATSATTTKSFLLTFLEQAASDCKHSSDCCWLDIRMTKPEDYFKIPRWHQDGNYFEHTTASTAQPRSKWATTLLGPSTLFLDLDFSDPELRDYVNFENEGAEWRSSQSDDPDNSVNKKKVDDYLRGKKGPKIVELELGQVVRFGYGQLESPVHSEPDMSGGDRVFVSVMFGFEGEMRELSKRWKVQWGEGWS
ncbi:MAG: hypothetical protein HETSPECPRED_004487 [Heterodermia speciosa]|uniref:Uncharacterized protein n=1 Tax=Heterodermia speciosa TaxID=116794 RepID=A0A8H3PJN1_9LECA|nr:MAG: hypothetical protein HETSPECPRED_004487 [Heterodermia speciosa]